MEYKKLSYRKQSARQLRTQYVEGISTCQDAGQSSLITVKKIC